ncbi:Cysteine desulfurase IscS [Mycovorax composti]|jgi:Cysteine sulfinate desulfinase/cysteine desulfurase and related enzymes|uniref:cysteine desulfurase n=1 Tax=Mycovorax composti TaxID=2962693 RepID=A0ABZ2EFY5_9BACT
MSILSVPVYMDYSATTPCDERVVDAMLPYFTRFFGNTASRIHSYGWQAEAAVELAREQVAQIIHAQPKEIVFTSGATEACNLALRGVVELYAVKGNHIITTKTEHKAVLDTCKALEKKGAIITYLDVDANGLIDLTALEQSITPSTILVSIMLANNETGVVQNVAEIGKICKQHKVLFFCDATQAVGKIPIDVLASEIDLLAFSSHKIYGPKGVGALYIRSRNPRVKIAPQITGGGHENNLRSGTLNVTGIVGFGKACSICMEELSTEQERLTRLRDRLKDGLLQIPNTTLNGHPSQRLPNVLNISFPPLNSGLLLSALNKSIALSSGSACTSGSLDPSYVLSAMGIDDTHARAALRFSIGRFTTEEEIDFAIREVNEKVTQLRNEGMFIG